MIYIEDDYLKTKSHYFKKKRLSRLMANIRRSEYGEYLVTSDHDSRRNYEVYNSRRIGWICTCKFFALKQKSCIHIAAAQEYEKYIIETES